MPAPSPAATAHDRTATVVDDVFYPSSDGKPMAENMWQARAILNAASDIESAHPQALVATDILVYPEEGNSRNSIAPDVLVAFALGTESRMNYLVWKEGKPPDWVLEVASQSTRRRDLDFKRRYYAAMAVPEYWLFDPRGDLYPLGTPPLQGLRLVNGEYRPLASRLVSGERTIHSEQLGLDVRAQDQLLRFRDPATGRDILHRPEVDAAQKQAQAMAEQEAERRIAAEARAEQAEARLAELEATLRRTRDNPS